MEYVYVGQDELKLIKAVRKLGNTSPLCCPWEDNSAQARDLEIPGWFWSWPWPPKLSGMGERVMLALCYVCEAAFLTSTMILRTMLTHVISSFCSGGNCDTHSSGLCCVFCSLICVFVGEIALGLHLNIPDTPLILAFCG